MFSTFFYHKALDRKNSIDALANALIQAMTTIPAKNYMFLVQRCALDKNFKLWRKYYKAEIELSFAQQCSLITENLVYINHLNFLSTASSLFKPVFIKSSQKQLLRIRERVLKTLQYASRNPILPDEWEGFSNLLTGYKSQLESCELPQAKLDKAILEKARNTFKPMIRSA